MEEAAGLTINLLSSIESQYYGTCPHAWRNQIRLASSMGHAAQIT
jgi:hypothetical protein